MFFSGKRLFSIATLLNLGGPWPYTRTKASDLESLGAMNDPVLTRSLYSPEREKRVRQMLILALCGGYLQLWIAGHHQISGTQHESVTDLLLTSRYARINTLMMPVQKTAAEDETCQGLGLFGLCRLWYPNQLDGCSLSSAQLQVILSERRNTSPS